MTQSDRNPDDAVETQDEAVTEEARLGDGNDVDWFLEQASRGQLLLGHGHVDRAQEVFQATLVRLGEAPSYQRAVILERLGRCCLMRGAPMPGADLFQQAMEVTETLPFTLGVKGLQGVLQSSLGDALAAIGQLDEARKAYEAAVAVATDLNDRRAQGVDLDHLGTLALQQSRIDDARAHHEAALRHFQEMGERVAESVARQHLGAACEAGEHWQEAETHLREAARLREACNDWSSAAQAWSQLAALGDRADRPEAAEEGHRKAIEATGRTGNALSVRRSLVAFARFLQERTDRLDEARQLAEAALASLTLETYAPDVWQMYGILAGLAEKEAAGAGDAAVRALREAQARAYRNIEQYGPRLQDTLAGLAEAPSYARAVLMERLGRCFLMGERPALAAAFLGHALALSEKIATSDDVKALQGVAQLELGDGLRAAGRTSEAPAAYEAALATAVALRDRRGQGAALDHLGALAGAGSKDARARHAAALKRFSQAQEPPLDAGAAEPAITLNDEIVTDCVLDTDLLVDVGSITRTTVWTGAPDPLADDVHPVLRPCARTYVDEPGCVRFCLPPEEPELERHADCTVMRKTSREVRIAGASATLWKLLRGMDGAHTVKQLLSGLSEDERPQAARVLAALAATGAVDVSGRALGRLVHMATKKGVLPGGGLKGDDVLRLATDGNYRAYAEAAHIALTDAVPETLRPFHALTRARRSRRDYAGRAIAKEDLEALLNTACGVTGTMPWEGRELKLRAYPSSGALYAVEIYPVVLRVDALAPGIYHYAPGESALDVVTTDVGKDDIVAASLPVEQQMVAGAAAMVCLVGQFRRHERKYGEGGYRMMVAEAGHISQNLVLAATALGLSARPFGGVFDGLINRALQLNEAEEQFLLAVLIGHAGGAQKAEAEGRTS